MSNPEGAAPAGWYPDPQQPGRLRYFDGHEWTAHFHHEGRLPSISAWLNATFGVLGEHGVAAFGLASALGLVGSVITWVGIRQVLGDVAVIDDEIVNFGGGTIVAALVALAATLLWQGFTWLALNRYLQLAHLQREPTAADALFRAATRLPRLVAVYVALFAAMLGIAVVVAVLAVASVGLALFALFVMLIAAVWVFVKLPFLTAAVVAAPREAPVVQASAGVSRGRFWAVLGRLLLVFASLAIIGGVLDAIVGGVGSPIDQDALANIVEVDGDEVILADFRFDDLLPSAGDFVLYVIVSTVVGAATTVVSTSALMRLYLDSGAPSEV